MIKFFKNEDIIITPFTIAKKQSIDTILDDLILGNVGETLFPIISPVVYCNDNISSSCETTLVTNSDYLAISQPEQIVNFQIGKYVPSGSVFYPSGSQHYNAETNPLNLDGTYQRQVYNTIQKMYYNNYNNAYNIFGINGYNNSYMSSSLVNDISVVNLTISQTGDKIKPKTLVLNNQSGDIIADIIDDGKNNLFLSGTFFINKIELNSTSKDLTEPLEGCGLGGYLTSIVKDNSATYFKDCCLPSPTPSITPSNSVTPSVTPSNSVTPSVTPSNSVTPSITPSNSVTPSITTTMTPSVTPSLSATPSVTPSLSATPSVTPSITPSASIPPTATPSMSITPSLSASPSVTPSTNVSPSPSPSRQPTVTPSPTPPPSKTPAPTPTTTPSITVSPSSTPLPAWQDGVYYLIVKIANTNIYCSAEADTNAPTFYPTYDLDGDGTYAAIQPVKNYNPDTIAKAVMDSNGNVIDTIEPYIEVVMNRQFLETGGSPSNSNWNATALTCKTKFFEERLVGEEESLNEEDKFPCSFDDRETCTCGPDYNEFDFAFSYESLREQCYSQRALFLSGDPSGHSGLKQDPFIIIQSGS